MTDSFIYTEDSFVLSQKFSLVVQFAVPCMPYVLVHILLSFEHYSAFSVLQCQFITELIQWRRQTSVSSPFPSLPPSVPTVSLSHALPTFPLPSPSLEPYPSLPLKSS